MTFGDHDSIDDDVLSALKADARSGVPRGSRDRVMRRLGLGAGVLGATATVSTGAGALLAGAVASHSTTLLVSTLALGIGLGFGARSGIDVFRSPEARAVPTAVAPPAPAPSPSPLRTPSRLFPQNTAIPVAPAPPSTTRKAIVHEPAPRAREPLAPSTSLLPAPVVAPPGLAAQQALLDDARGALTRHDGTSALSALGAHRLRFPDTVLAEERAALEIRALVVLGRLEEARERHAAFERAFPNSLFAPSLAKLLPSPSAESVTEASPLPARGASADFGTEPLPGANERVGAGRPGGAEETRKSP